MGWKIILGVVALGVVGFVYRVVRLAVAEAKEEAEDIARASKREE